MCAVSPWVLSALNHGLRKDAKMPSDGALPNALRIDSLSIVNPTSKAGVLPHVALASSLCCLRGVSADQKTYSGLSQFQGWSERYKFEIWCVLLDVARVRRGERAVRMNVLAFVDRLPRACGRCQVPRTRVSGPVGALHSTPVKHSECVNRSTLACAVHQDCRFGTFVLGSLHAPKFTHVA